MLGFAAAGNFAHCHQFAVFYAASAFVALRKTIFIKKRRNMVQHAEYTDNAVLCNISVRGNIQVQQKDKNSIQKKSKQYLCGDNFNDKCIFPVLLQNGDV